MNPHQITSEESLIQTFLAPLAAAFPGAFGLTDDCAAIRPTAGSDLIVKTDPIAAGVHFLADDAPEDIAWKALAVNVSDLAAKGAEPRAYVMALSFPEPPPAAWMQRFAGGLAEAQAAFGMHLIGGDTDRRPGPITITITVFGEVPAGGMVRRGTARPGDLIFVSGALGAAATGLALLRSPELSATWALAPDEAAEVIHRFHRPTPRLDLRLPLRRHASAAMDLSDGLAKDLGRMCKSSACGAELRLDAIPVLRATAKALAADPAHVAAIVATGDDYEVLAAVPPGERAAFEAASATAMPGTPMTCIGSMRHGSEVSILGADSRPLLLEHRGWDHF